MRFCLSWWRWKVQSKFADLTGGFSWLYWTANLHLFHTHFQRWKSLWKGWKWQKLYLNSQSASSRSWNKKYSHPLVQYSHPACLLQGIDVYCYIFTYTQIKIKQYTIIFKHTIFKLKLCVLSCRLHSQVIYFILDKLHQVCQRHPKQLGKTHLRVIFVSWKQIMSASSESRTCLRLSLLERMPLMFHVTSFNMLEIFHSFIYGSIFIWCLIWKKIKGAKRK